VRKELSMKPSTEARPARRGGVAALAAALALVAVGVAATVAPAAAQTTSCTSYWAQAGAFRSIDNATRFLAETKRLAGGSVPVVVLVAPVAGLPMYRVVAGPLTQAEADVVAAGLRAGGIVASISTRTTECPTGSGPGAPGPTVTTSAGSNVSGQFRVQVGAFRSSDYAMRLANDTQAKLGANAPAGEITVTVASVGGAPLYRVQSQAHSRAAAEALLAHVRAVQPTAAAVLVVA
jgi:cell division protein FtsN